MLNYKFRIISIENLETKTCQVEDNIASTGGTIAVILIFRQGESFRF
jgi:hypothetical protein